MLNRVVLVHLYWLCRIPQSLHPGGGPRDSCYTASTQKNSWRNPIVAAFQLHLCICSEINCAQSHQFPAQENHLELVCCSKSFMKDDLLETWEFVLIQTERCDGNCENNCSSPEAEQCYVWVPAAWDREGWEKPQQDREAPKMPLSYLWPFG